MTDPEEAKEQWEQMISGVSEATVRLFSFYQACIAQGFTPTQSMELVVVFFDKMLDIGIAQADADD